MVDERGIPWFGDGSTPGGVSHRATDDGNTFNRAVFDRLRDQSVSIYDGYLPTDPDFTAGAQRVLDTGKNLFLPKLEGGYKLHDGITMAAGGQQIISDGAYGGYFHMESDFNIDAPGVLTIPPGGNNRQAGTTNVGFLFDQPTTATSYSQLIQYPWAINAPGVSRMQFNGVTRIQGGWNGVNMDAIRNGTTIVSNCGGTVIDQFEIGCFNRAYYFDDIADSLHINTLKNWPFGGIDATGLPIGNLYNLYSSAANLGGYIGRVDGLDIKTIAHFRAPLSINQGVSGGNPFGAIHNLQMDGDRSALTFNQGNIKVGRSYFSTTLPLEQFIVMNNGELEFGSPWFLGPGVTGNAPLIELNAGLLQLGSPSVDGIGLGSSMVQQIGGELEWIGGKLNTYSNQAYTQPMFDIRAGRATIKNPRFMDIGTGSGVALKIATDGWHDIEMNALINWTRSIPTSVTLGTYKFGASIVGPAL